MKIIACEKICKTYAMGGIDVHALKGINLTMKKGEFTAIAGPSGSGKTTLLNVIGGLDSPTSGRVSIGGSLLNNLKAREIADIRLRKIGFVFQAYNLIPVLSALENVEYILLIQGVSKKEVRERAGTVLELVGLSAEMNRRPHELSGGQQQRVAVARAIVSEPEVVLADEPTANLDQKTGEMLIDLMLSLNRFQQITFLFSTHDPMVMASARRLVTLRDGLIVEDKTRVEIV